VSIESEADKDLALDEQAAENVVGGLRKKKAKAHRQAGPTRIAGNPPATEEPGPVVDVDIEPE